jgi:hypothetical protein
MSELTAQTSIDEMVYRNTLPSNDTIVFHRQKGDWWLGFYGGGNLNISLGKLQMPFDPTAQLTSFNTLLSFPMGFGAGLLAGFVGDWLPVNNKFGASLNLSVYDWHNYTTQKSLLNGTRKINISYSYLSVSPSVKYCFPIKGITLSSGFDFDFLTSSQFKYYNEENNAGQASSDAFTLPVNFSNFRFGVHIGTSFDLYSFDYNNRIRVFLTPFATLQMSTSDFKEWGSSSYILSGKFGLSMRFGPDVVRTDTLKFNPEQAPPPALASANFGGSISFAGYKPYTPISSSINKPIEFEEPPPYDPTVFAEASVERETKPIINITKKFQYDLYSSNNDACSLSKESKAIMDVIAVDMQTKNKTIRLKLEGHSDDQGTLNEQTERAKCRVERAREYMMKVKGINKERLLVDIQPLRPIVRNDSEGNRKKNRCVRFIYTQ